MGALPTPSADDELGFHTNVPVSDLIERDTRAIEASAVSSAPPVAEATDGVTHESQPTPTEPNDAQGLRMPNTST